MPNPRELIQTSANEGPTLSKATIRAADKLGLPRTLLAAILGISPATVSRMANGEYALRRDTKAFELAVLLVRLYRSLDAIVGDEEVARQWLRSSNTALRNEPINLIRNVQGLVDVIQYLDARRAII
jgi:transcriptional regulator with XRE-family HTH domain